MATIEDRIASLESEVSQLKKRMQPTENGDWLQQFSGSMQDYPEFEEVLRLGRQFRCETATDDDASDS